MHDFNVLLQLWAIIEATSYFSAFVAGHSCNFIKDSQPRSQTFSLTSNGSFLTGSYGLLWLGGAVHTRLKHSGKLSGARRPCVSRKLGRGERGREWIKSAAPLSTKKDLVPTWLILTGRNPCYERSGDAQRINWLILHPVTFSAAMQNFNFSS